MASLYEIQKEILNCVDDETGEIIDYDKLTKLQLDKAVKIESIGLWFKNITAEIAAIKAEIDNLSQRKKRAENRAESLKRLLKEVLGGEKFETARVQMSYRASTVCDIDETEFLNWAMQNSRDDLLTFKTPTPNKAAIKNAINGGEEIPYAALKSDNNLQIK